MSQPFSQLPQLRRTNRAMPVALVLGAMLAVAVMGGGMYFGLKGIKSLLPRREQLANVPAFAETAWGERKIEEVRLQAPCEFGPGPNVAEQLPDNVRELIGSMQTYQSLGTPGNFVVMLSRVIYDSKIEANLDGAVQGTITEAAARLGDFKPKYDSKPITVSGVEGRRSLYKRAMQGEMMHLETVTVCKENRLWQVQVIYLRAESRVTASRILESVAMEF